MGHGAWSTVVDGELDVEKLKTSDSLFAVHSNSRCLKTEERVIFGSGDINKS
jgi:hypothetical protein